VFLFFHSLEVFAFAFVFVLVCQIHLGLKPAAILSFCGTTEQAAEKVQTKGEFGKGWIGTG
jgi:hypothetical protein